MRPLLVLFLLGSLLPAQRGDRSGEVQAELPEHLRLPPPAPLSPEQALQVLRVAPGLRVELVAAEPLVQDPVAIAFDAQARLWVVEMRGFMRDVDGTGEHEPVGRISVLEDADDDGRYDKGTVFLEGLVLPRALGLVRGGVLVLEAGALWFCPDADGDLRADRRVLVEKGFAAGLANPEHAPNGFVRGLDGWLELANFGERLLDTGPGTFARERVFQAGQWGLAFDDYGRRYYDYNSDALRVDLWPARYGARHPVLGFDGNNVRVVSDQHVWPIRPTPGVNRGYQKDFLRADGTLQTVTAACGPLIDRGGLLPAPYAGCAFVCEPAANLVLRYTLPAPEVTPDTTFLASTDERFRPVNLANGPDGALYVVDMARGVIQHRNFVTTFLRRQIEARQLAQPIGRGRIWRIVPQAHRREPVRRLAGSTSAELVDCLRDRNGWVRTEAQRLLAEREARETVPGLRAVLRAGGDVRARLHAFWLLAAWEEFSILELRALLADPEPMLRRAALQRLEPALRRTDPAQALAAAVPLLLDGDPGVRVQAMLSLGECGAEQALDALAGVARVRGSERHVASAIASGSLGREEALLARLRDGEPQQIAPLVKALTKALEKSRAATPASAEPKAVAAGRPLFSVYCAGCHQPNGEGLAGLAPPLADSAWLRGGPEPAIKIVLHGVAGPLEVRGETWNLAMPGLPVLDDEQVAAILSFVRATYGNEREVVTPAQVRTVRAAHRTRASAWTQEELRR